MANCGSASNKPSYYARYGATSLVQTLHSRIAHGRHRSERLQYQNAYHATHRKIKRKISKAERRELIETERALAVYHARCANVLSNLDDNPNTSIERTQTQ